MKYIFWMIVFLLLPTSVYAQGFESYSRPNLTPTSISIKKTELTDSTKFTISWSSVPNYTSYDVITYSNPRRFELEQIRVVTGTSWIITVPRTSLKSGLKFYVSVRVSMSPPKYGSITY